MKLLWIAVLGFSLPAFSLTSDQIEKLKIEATVEAGPGISFKFTPPEKHHFNLKAPNKITLMGDSGKAVLPEKWEINSTLATAQWKPATTGKNCTINAKVFVCDNDDSYCVPKNQNFDCKGKPVGAHEMHGDTETSAVVEKNNLFIVDDPKAAEEKSTSERKLLFIDFSAIWCPSCNQLEETVFNLPAFKKYKNDFVFLKLDVDKEISWQWKSKYRIQGYPTIVILGPAGNEVIRVVGARRPTAMLKIMQTAIKNKYLLPEKISDYDAGMMALDRGEYSQAHRLLLRASRHWTASDPRRNDLLSADIGVQEELIKKNANSLEAKRDFSDLLIDSIDWYPITPQALDRAEKLQDLADEMQDETLKTKANNLAIRVAKGLVANPQVYRDADLSLADVYVFLARTYGTEKNDAVSKEYFSKAAIEYEKMIKASGLSAASERGFNLERAFCLWKSGQYDEADKIYIHLQKVYPDEFTFFYQHAQMFKDQKKWEQALNQAQIAFKFSYGDNKLRVTALLAETEKNLGRPKEGVALIDDVLKEYQVPENSEVRTKTYISRLKKLKAELGLVQN